MNALAEISRDAERTTIRFSTNDEIGGKERKRVPFYWEGGMDPGASTAEMDLD